jgi:uncharacterized membrane protein
MPEMTLLGWVHTLIAIIALIAGFYTLALNKVIVWQHTLGKIYLICTFLAATTALMIYNQGDFGPAHRLAVLTLLALFAGFLVSEVGLFAKIAVYFQAFCFSSTLLFHMIPAITDGLLRLPLGSPILTNKHDPLLVNFYILFLAIFVMGSIAQFLWLRKQSAEQTSAQGPL